MCWRPFRPEIAVLAFLAALAVPARAEESTAKDKTTHKSGAKEEGGGNGAGEAAQTYSVVQVGRTVTVLKGSEVAAYRKKVAAEYDESVKAYNEAKKKAAKAKKKFTDQKPERPTVKVVASSLKSEETADSICEKTLASIEKKRKKEIEEKAKKQKSG